MISEELLISQKNKKEMLIYFVLSLTLVIPVPNELSTLSYWTNMNGGATEETSQCHTHGLT
jgi:hypothetical protein